MLFINVFAGSNVRPFVPGSDVNYESFISIVSYSLSSQLIIILVKLYLCVLIEYVKLIINANLIVESIFTRFHGSLALSISLIRVVTESLYEGN